MNTVTILMRGLVAAVRETEGGDVLWACQACAGKEAIALLAAWEWCQSHRLHVLGEKGHIVDVRAARVA